MILKTSIILTFNLIWLNSVSGASFSKVFVQSGAEVVPIEYVQYGAPSVSVASSQLAQISAASVGSVVPLSSGPNYLPPCAIPCVYPGSSVAAVQPAAPNYVTYKSSVPVVVARRDESTGYEYSYIVYDENTGDHKSQHEHSDGSVVHGEYSLIQPDGYVREVQYVADDLKGFNAIVKKFLPVNVEKNVDHKEKKDPGTPCHEVKNEPIKHAAHHEEKPSEESNEKSSEESHEAHMKKTSEEKHVEKFNEENSPEQPSAALTASESHETKSDEDHKNVSHEGHAEPVSSEEHSTELSHEEHKTKHSGEHKESHEGHKKDSREQKESHESHEEPSHEVDKESHEGHAVTAHEAKSDHHETAGNALVSYNDIIKCLQSAIRNSNGLPTPYRAESPLTYIILNKPC